MSSIIIAMLVFVSLTVLGGAILSPAVPDQVWGLQWSILAQFYAALTSVITPISSLYHDGVNIVGQGINITSANGPWPMVVLILAGMVAAMITYLGGEGVGGGVLSVVAGGLAIVGCWILLGFVAVPVISGGQEQWYTELDQAIGKAMYSRPLEFPSIIVVPMGVSIATSLAFYALFGSQKEESQRTNSLFPWRQQKGR